MDILFRGCDRVGHFRPDPVQGGISAKAQEGEDRWYEDDLTNLYPWGRLVYVQFSRATHKRSTTSIEATHI